MAQNFKLNLANTVKSTAKKTAFLTIGENETFRLRFLPPTLDNGSLFFLTTNHYHLKEEDDKSVVYACRRTHQDEPCPLCDLAYHLMDNGDKAEKKMGKEIKPSNNWYAQVMLGEEDENEKISYTGPFLMRFSKKGADALTAILKVQQRSKRPFFCDEKKGQDIDFSRDGKGFDTTYTAMATGEVVDLNAIVPEWKTKQMPSIEKVCDLKHKSPDEMINAAMLALPSLAWADISNELGWADKDA